MTFELDKKNALSKKDKSTKGEIDRHIAKLLDIINDTDDYYTSSSCSGRMILFETEEAGSKYDVRWIMVSHDKVKSEQISDAIICTERQLWLRQESFILHVCCRDMTKAIELVHMCRELGLKRAGVISARSKIVVEIINTPSLNTIIAARGKILVDQQFIRAWTVEANRNMDSNLGMIRRLEDSFLKMQDKL